MMRSMFGPTFNDFYRATFDKVRVEILKETDTQILGSEVDTLAQYYYEKYALAPIQFDPANLEFEINKEVKRVAAQQRDEFYRNDGPIDWEYQSAIINLPIQLHYHIDTIKQLQGGQIFMDGFN